MNIDLITEKIFFLLHFTLKCTINIDSCQSSVTFVADRTHHIDIIILSIQHIHYSVNSVNIIAHMYLYQYNEVCSPNQFAVLTVLLKTDD